MDEDDEREEPVSRPRASGAGRTFLLLQGPMSWFFTYLGASLRERGATVHRILVCPGDALFWRGPNGVAYRGKPRDWPIYLEAFMKNRGVTDIVCLGDGRRWHDDAVGVADEAGARIHIVEQGYIRPGWLTVEPNGTGGRSGFPDDWDEIESLDHGSAPKAPKFEAGFMNYAAMDVAFNLANILAGWLLFPHYRQHAIDHPTTEWAGWMWNKALRSGRRKRALAAAEAKIAAHAGPLHILPLQLETDYQIRLHGPPGGMEAMLRRTVLSFARHAPEHALLVIKAHPLDHGWTDWGALTRLLSEEAGVADRCVHIDGGDLDAMLARAAGVLVVNSTVGLSALRAGAPVIALGAALYDLPGLTFGGELDDFWTGATPPDPDRLATLIGALTSTIQVPGGFDGSGAKPGAAAVAEAMLAPAPY